MTKLSSRDKALGMDRAISRRDFLNGVALTAGALTAGGLGGMGLSASPARAEAAPLSTGPDRTSRSQSQFLRRHACGARWRLLGQGRSTGSDR